MDIVIVGTPSHTPCHLAREAARRGCSDLLEKPSCLAIAEYDSVIEQMSSDAVLMTAISAVFRADVRLLVDSIGPGPFDIGASWWRREGVPGVNSWFTDRKFAGGGALLDLGWHLADVAYAMFTASMTGVTSELTPMANLSASARWRRSTDMATASSARDVEVAGRLTVHFADGSVLRISTAWASEVTYDCTRIRIATPQRSADLQTTFGFSPNRESAPRLVLADGTASTVHSFENQTGSEYTEQVNAMITAVYQARQGVPRPFGWTHNARVVMNFRSKPMLQREPRCNIGTENISLMGGQPAPSP